MSTVAGRDEDCVDKKASASQLVPSSGLSPAPRGWLGS